MESQIKKEIRVNKAVYMNLFEKKTIIIFRHTKNSGRFLHDPYAHKYELRNNRAVLGSSLLVNDLSDKNRSKRSLKRMLELARLIVPPKRPHHELLVDN